ncbi:hypothetical protein DVA67_004665 [Solirubrobacter sp. CPCC 204708]|uniref:Uncharacterized protein n=1 Tax=Solirubrobacter deserti TaxID=2282478 RepID=A0ABT4RHJ5_9ACTN|nr:hypothetical protein [Solirubrobacter deserti]MBE2315254.1 hypothetical protein [Solirubrobacter deserti]MDA0137938.1 hypothetical protein [Solirubrobacter deserti]
MKKTLTACAVVGAAALAASPAGAAEPPRILPPDIPFPADQIEHRVSRHCQEVSGIYAQFGRNGCLTIDSWITSDRDHEVARDATSGELIAENATVDGTVFSWTANRNVLFVVPTTPNRPSNITREARAAMTRELIQRGWYQVSGEQVRDGRALLVLTETAQSPADSGNTTLLVDKASYETVEMTFVSRDGKQKFVDTQLSVEQLPRNAANSKLLNMGDHPTATVRQVEGDDDVIASAARKVGIKAKTRAKIARKARAGKKAGR